MAGKVKDVPWYEHNAPDELKAWFEEDPEGFRSYIAGRWEEWNSIKETMAPDQPHPLSYSQGEEDRQYAVDLNIFINRQATEQAQEAVFERHKPLPQRPPVDVDFLAMSSKDPKDQKVGKEITRNKYFIKDQLKEADRLEALGELGRARTARERAAMMSRAIQQTREKHKYTFIEERDKALEENATNELERALSLSPEEVSGNLEYFQGLVTAFNATSGENFSFVIDGPSAYDPNRGGEIKITKVVHDPFRSCDISRLAENTGQSHLDILLRKGYGVTNPEAKAEAEADQQGYEEKFEQSLKPLEQGGSHI